MAQKPVIDKAVLSMQVRNPEYVEPTPPDPPTVEDLQAARQTYRELVAQIITDWQDSVPTIRYVDIYRESRNRGADIRLIRNEIAWLISQVDKFLNPDDFVEPVE